MLYDYVSGYVPREIYTMDEPLMCGPQPVNPASETELHVLTSNVDARLARWALMSWYRLNGRNDRLVIHDDGSLSEVEAARFAAMFPGCEIIFRKDADEAIECWLAAFPSLILSRRQNPLMIKVLDFLFFARCSRFIVMDSDVLSFQPLPSLGKYLRCRENVFMRDYQLAFNVKQEVFSNLCLKTRISEGK